jgi:uncharacterized protein
MKNKIDSKIIKQIEDLVKNCAGDEDWSSHVLKVKKYAIDLAVILKADLEVTELAAILHDIGRYKFGGKNHEETGAVEAEKILQDFKIPQTILDRVVSCIRTHKADKDNLPASVEAEILANADAMAHFDSVPFFFYKRSKDLSFEEIINWVEEKLKEDWQEKLTLEEARKLIAEKYKNIKILLESSKTIRD